MKTFHVLCIALLICSAFVAVQAAGLPKLNIDRKGITVSGISAGGFMAVQFHLAHSNVIAGAGVIAGGPYWCAQDQLSNAFIQCMYATMPINVDTLVSRAKANADSGKIDPLSNIANSPVWIFSGTKDTVVSPKVVQATADFYQALNANVTEVFDVAAQHSQITDNYGSACSFLGSPYINNCDLDGAGEIFKKLYGDLKPRTSANSGNLQSYDQSSYVGGIGYSGIAKTGYVYIPTGCKDGSNVCKLHLAFHGCGQTHGTIGDAYVTHAGYNAWAESNNIVILYPQAEGSALHSNPNACFDWWGYGNASYAVKSGRQITAISNMISAISGF